MTSFRYRRINFLLRGGDDYATLCKEGQQRCPLAWAPKSLSANQSWGADGCACPSMAESVDHFAAIIWIYASLFEAVLLVRAWQTKNLSQFPSFYAYIAFLFLTSGILLPIYLLWPSYYPSAFWFRFTIQLLLEFMVLLEVSDHIFSRYVAICHLGKLLTLGICIVFAVFYIYPSLVSQEGQAAVILEFNKRVAFTKAIIIVVLLAAIVRFHIHLGRNTSGILLGFSVYLAIVVVNLALEEDMARLFTAACSPRWDRWATCSV